MKVWTSFLRSGNECLCGSHICSVWPSSLSMYPEFRVFTTPGFIPADRWEHLSSDQIQISLRHQRTPGSRSQLEAKEVLYPSCGHTGWVGRAKQSFAGLLIQVIGFRVSSKGKIFLLAKQKWIKAQWLSLKWRCRNCRLPPLQLWVPTSCTRSFQVNSGTAELSRETWYVLMVEETWKSAG